MNENDEQEQKKDPSAEASKDVKGTGDKKPEEDETTSSGQPSGPSLVNLDMLEEGDEDGIEILEVSATDDSGFVIPDVPVPADDEEEVDVDMDFDFDEPDDESAEGVESTELDALKEQLAEKEVLLAGVEAELTELKDRMLRSAADHENYRKRIKRERAEEKLQAASGLVKQLLPVGDNLSRALTQAESTESEDPALDGIIEGLGLIRAQLFDTLTKAGLEPIDTEGTFDPAVHEALMQEPVEDRPHMSILEVFEEGYLLAGRLLRPARVKVALNPAGAAESAEDEEREAEQPGLAESGEDESDSVEPVETEGDDGDEGETRDDEA